MANRMQSTVAIARVVLEAETALSIATGNPDGVFDSALVRDANGLPALPGTSVAGVLRHIWCDLYDSASADKLFGFQDRQQARSSRVVVSWGAMLDSRGEPAEGLITDKQRLDDPLFHAVLQQMDAPIYRDRVRLGHKGAAMDKGKFDRSVVPAGHRFALEIRLWTDPDDENKDWEKLLGLLQHPGFRLGGMTRAGLGRMRLVSLHQHQFDLRQAAPRRAFLELGRGLLDIRGLQATQPQPIESDAWLSAELNLEARGLWRIGEGSTPLSQNADKPADLLPKTEERISWKDGRGERQMQMLLLPGTSLKGALAHRMAFHARRFSGQWVPLQPDDTRPTVVDDLMGAIKCEDDPGHAGVLYMDDGWMTVAPKNIVNMMHNAIDRFTGGVREHALFEEENILGGKITIPLALNLKRIQGDPELVRRSFQAALQDLCEGRLALGARTTTGHGFFTGQLQGSISQWLDDTPVLKESA